LVAQEVKRQAVLVATQLLTQVRVAAAVQVLPQLQQAVTVPVDLWQFVIQTQTH
jgi:hypothetical protein